MKKKKRTLYECFNAKVDTKRIYCSKGYPLTPEQVNLHPMHLEKGEPLAPKICQQCINFDRMGPANFTKSYGVRWAASPGRR
jgi:hypothetical protein